MKKLLLLLILFSACLASAQQEAMYTHYMYNIMAVNPAYAGYEGRMTTTLLHRSQWESIPGAPHFQTFSANSPIGNNVGAGFSLVNSQIGPERNIAIKGYYSYTLPTNKKLKISFGLKAGFNMLYIGLKDLRLDYPGDQDFMTDIQSVFLPNFGVGFLAYTNNYYFGFSIPDLIQHDYLSNSIFSSSNLTLNSKKYYFVGGASFSLNSHFVFKPSTFISMSASSTDSTGIAVEADLSALLIIDNKYTGGLMFRSGGIFAFLFGMKITKEIEFGYSFDLLISNPSKRYNGGNHELVLKYNFKTRRGKGSLACPTFQ